MDAVKGWLVVLAAAAVAAPSVDAQTVQKCVARGGGVRYQSAPCAPGERVAEVWEATPDPLVEPGDDTVGPTRRNGTARGTTRRRTVRSSTVERRIAKATEDRCERARAYRDAVEQRAGLDRDYDLLATLQRRVFDACR